MKRLHDRIAILLPFVILAAADWTLTLMAQPNEYWSNHSVVREGNDLFARLLSLGPTYFIASGVAWFIIFGFAFSFGPRLAAFGLGVSMIYAHSTTVLGAMRVLFFSSFWHSVPYFMAMAFLLIWIITDQMEKHLRERNANKMDRRDF